MNGPGLEATPLISKSTWAVPLAGVAPGAMSHGGSNESAIVPTTDPGTATMFVGIVGATVSVPTAELIENDMVELRTLTPFRTATSRKAPDVTSVHGFDRTVPEKLNPAFCAVSPETKLNPSSELGEPGSMKTPEATRSIESAVPTCSDDRSGIGATQLGTTPDPSFPLTNSESMRPVGVNAMTLFCRPNAMDQITTDWNGKLSRLHQPFMNCWASNVSVVK